MPKDPRRNVDRFKIVGAHLNEFEFHKHQEEFAEQFEPPVTGKARASKPLTQAERVALIAAQAHRKAQKMKRRDSGKTAGKKVASKNATKK